MPPDPWREYRLRSGQSSPYTDPEVGGIQPMVPGNIRNQGSTGVFAMTFQSAATSPGMPSMGGMPSVPLSTQPAGRGQGGMMSPTGPPPGMMPGAPTMSPMMFPGMMQGVVGHSSPANVGMVPPLPCLGRNFSMATPPGGSPHGGQQWSSMIGSPADLPCPNFAQPVQHGTLNSMNNQAGNSAGIFQESIQPNFGAQQFAQFLDAGLAQPPPAAGYGSAFEALGKQRPDTRETSGESSQDVILKALQQALTGEKKSPPTWGGSPENLRPWLKQLALWELDNHLPKVRWGVRLLQSLPEGSPPRRIAETVDTTVLMSEAGYSAVLSAIMTRYAPFLEAVGPAAIDHFFFGLERTRSDTLAAYITAMETAMHEVANHVGETIPAKIAGRILLKHAHLSDAQREQLAIKHNALLTFDQVARALRPLDRPEALLNKVSKTFLVGERSTETSTYAAAVTEEMEAEDELVPDEGTDLESDGEGGLKELMFDPEREYAEDEMQFVWAYNMAYKDVRKEMQNRRKGRQFFKPKGVKKGFEKGKGKSSGKKSEDKNRTKGTPEELLLRTRCWTCDELGHRSKDCPQKDKAKIHAPSSSSYFVGLNPNSSGGAIYVGTSFKTQGVISVYAGVRTEEHEAIVDTAAEEAVIGSRAMQGLRRALQAKGLQPRLAEGATAACAGIGGSANISSIWDIPISVAETPGLIRVTEIQDAENFETPFLLPISFLELMGADIFIRKDLLKLDNGKVTSMRRTPSGHRAVSVTDFAEAWTIPEGIRKELKLHDGEDPFRCPVEAQEPRQGPGVAVWLKTKNGSYRLVKQFQGSRNYLIQPNEVFESHSMPPLSTARTTNMIADGDPMCSVYDNWTLNNHRCFPDWHGEVFFEEGNACISQVCQESSSLDPQHLSQEEVACCERVDHRGNHVEEDRTAVEKPGRGSSWTSTEAWKREMPEPVGTAGDSDLLHVGRRSAPASVGALDPTQHHGGFGDQGCASRKEGVSQGQVGQQASSGNWKAFDPIHRLQAMVARSLDVCSRRRSFASERNQRSLLVDMSGLWQSVGKSGMGRRQTSECSRNIQSCNLIESRSEPQHSSGGILRTAMQQHPSDDLHGIKGGISSTTTATKVSERSEEPVPDGSGELQQSSSGSAFESKSEAEEVSRCKEERRSVEDRGNGSIGGQLSGQIPSSRDFTRDGSFHSQKPKHVKWSSTNEGAISPPNPSLSGLSGNLRDPFIGRGSQGERGGERIQPGKPIVRKASVGMSQKSEDSSKSFHSTTISSRAFISVAIVSWCGIHKPEADWLQWLGPRMEFEEHNESTKNQYLFPLTHSSKELCRTDFDGQPAFLSKADRVYLTGRLCGYLDHIGEVYSPPRVTSEAQRQNLKATIALDLTNGWDFRLKKHRQAALELIARKRPAVIILSPPCTTYSRLRQWSDSKRSWEVVAAEREEGMLHLRFAVAIAEHQMRNGRGFVFEHPRSATSWQTEELQKLMTKPEVFSIKVDQCEFGLRIARGKQQGLLAQKPTLLLTNVNELADFVNRRCAKDHFHGQLVGGTAADAATYTPEFTKALVEGIKAALGLGKTTSKKGTACARGKSLGICLLQFARTTCELDSINEEFSSSLVQIDGEPPCQSDRWCGELSNCTSGEETRTSSTTNGLCRRGEIFRGPPFPKRSPSKTVLANRRGTRESEDDQTAEDLVRQQLKDVSQQSDVASAMAKVEDFVKTGEDEFALPPLLRKEVHRLHRNLGHPAQEVFLRAMKHAGVRTDIIDWTRKFFVCPICKAREKPTPARPGHLSRAMEFNTVIGIDLCYFKFGDETITLLNCLCWGTNFQQVGICKDRTAVEVRQTFWNEWIKHYGPPQLIVIDRGREFFNEEFQTHIGGLGVGLHYTDPESPWQNGRTEKAGGIFKEKLKAVTEQLTIARDELPICVAEVVSTRNRFMDRYGFSPMQRVFGKNLRVPASLLASDSLDQELVELAASDPIQRLWTIRECASQAWMKRQDKETIQRSLRANQRNADMKPLVAGSWVYVYRDNASYTGWTGPGVLIAESPGNRSWWISMRGRLWKAGREQIRLATSEEQLGAALVTELSKEMLEKLHTPGQLAYQDVTHENGPTEDDVQPDDLLRVLRITNDAHPGPAEEGEEPVLPEAADENLSTHAGSSHQVETLPTHGESRQESEMPDEVLEPALEVPPAGETADESMPSAVVEEPPDVPMVRFDLRVDEAPGGSMSFRKAENETPRNRPQPYPFSAAPPSLPKPPERTFYVEVTHFDKLEDLNDLEPQHSFVGVTWKFSREHRTTTLQQHPDFTESFPAELAEASYHARDKCLYITKAKTSFGQVEFRHLGEEEKELFRKARKKELDSLIANGAVKVLSIQESERFLQESPQHVIESKFVDRYKPKEINKESLEIYKKRALKEGRMDVIPLEKDHTNPKSRWCCVGWRDPDVHQVERSAPTPLSNSLYCCFQLAASRKWKTKIKDVKTAFLQSLPTTRTQKLACRQPRDESLPGLHPKQLILLQTEVYGLVSGPSWWRRSLIKLVTDDLGYKLNDYDKCVATLPSMDPHPKAQTDGFLVIEVDDIAEAGGERHQKKMLELEKKLKFGKVESLYGNSDGCMYAGRHIRQLNDFSFEHHMDEYIYTRLEPIQILKKVLKKDSDKISLNDREKTQLRGLIASLNWTAREGRPDASASASILATTFPEPSMSHIFAANDVVRHLKTFPIKLRIHAIPEGDLRNILIADSAFDTSGREKSQHGWLLGFTTPSMNCGETSPISLMQWRSRRLRRKAASSLLCESISLSAGTGALERQDAFMQSIQFSHFSPRTRQRTEDEMLSIMGKTTVIANESAEYRDPKSLAVIDAKALYDSLNSEQSQGEDDRAALELAIIKESLRAVRGRARWIPHNVNPADSLTKMSGAHTEPMLKLLKKNCFRIEEESEVLSRGKQSDSRLKVSTQTAGTLSFGGCETWFALHVHSCSCPTFTCLWSRRRLEVRKHFRFWPFAFCTVSCPFDRRLLIVT